MSTINKVYKLIALKIEMSIYTVKKPSNWRRVVKTLKEGPDFGIHGLKEDNLEAILKNECPFGRGILGEYVPAHYFAVGKTVKKWTDEKFYNALWASFDIALRFSGKYFSKNNQIIISGRPCLLLGVAKPRFRDSPFLVDDRDTIMIYSSYSDKSRERIRAFPVGHDFNRQLFDLYGINMTDEELDMIGRKLRQFCGNLDFPDDIASTYFILNQMIKGIIEKVYRLKL